jgi:hypothetical protein
MHSFQNLIAIRNIKPYVKDQESDLGRIWGFHSGEY